MKKLLKTAVAGLAASLILAGTAHAQLTPSSSGPACSDWSMALGGWTECRGSFAGNNLGSSFPDAGLVMAYINNQWGLGVTTSSTTEEGSSAGPFGNWGTDVGSGVLTFDNPIYGDFVVALKTSTYFSLYLFTGADGWTTLDFNTVGTQTNKNGVGKGLSHATLYGGEFTVPEPGTWFLLGSGLMGLAFVGSRRREDILG